MLARGGRRPPRCPDEAHAPVQTARGARRAIPCRSVPMGGCARRSHVRRELWCGCCACAPPRCSTPCLCAPRAPRPTVLSPSARHLVAHTALTHCEWRGGGVQLACRCGMVAVRCAPCQAAVVAPRAATQPAADCAAWPWPGRQPALLYVVVHDLGRVGACRGSAWSCAWLVARSAAMAESS